MSPSPTASSVIELFNNTGPVGNYFPGWEGSVKPLPPAGDLNRQCMSSVVNSTYLWAPLQQGGVNFVTSRGQHLMSPVQARRLFSFGTEL